MMLHIFAGQKNDLSIAPINNFYKFANIFWKFGEFTLANSKFAEFFSKFLYNVTFILGVISKWKVHLETKTIY